jgi:probable O-glycosylation ligase (exosortase A-associated)
MMLCALSALGAQSRSALLAIAAMALMLWWRGRNRLLGGIFMAVMAISLVVFMPDSWSSRMSTIQDYEQDSSAMGRINAWWTAWNLAFHYPLGVGFDAARPEVFARFAPDPVDIHAAHSIYFQVLGNHGFVGLFIFLLLWLIVWRTATKLRAQAAAHPQARWCSDLASMCQVSLLGYFVGGAFLSLAYFDLPYNIMVLVVLGRSYVASRAWEREPAVWRGLKIIPGLSYGAGPGKPKAV